MADNKFKIHIIGIIETEDDDNLDVFVYFPNNDVYVISVFTIKNVQKFVTLNGYCVSTDMLIIEKITEAELLRVINKLLIEERENFMLFFKKAGKIEDVNGYKEYDELPYLSNE